MTETTGSFSQFCCPSFYKDSKTENTRGTSLTWTSKDCHLKASVFISCVEWKHISECGQCLEKWFEILLLSVRESLGRETQNIILDPKKIFNSFFFVDY